MKIIQFDALGFQHNEIVYCYGTSIGMRFFKKVSFKNENISERQVSHIQTLSCGMTKEMLN